MELMSETGVILAKHVHREGTYPKAASSLGTTGSYRYCGTLSGIHIRELICSSGSGLFHLLDGSLPDSMSSSCSGGKIACG